MFGPETEDADVKEFTERCKDDRHHFRFIVSPEDATDMEDLKRFTRELMAQVEKDLGTKLEWVASITGTPTTPMSMSSCAAAPTMAATS
jgi:type IV secretory pathway VirD2 relaxase